MKFTHLLADGYSDHTHGYSGDFGWWRSSVRHGFWFVMCYPSKSHLDDGFAVTDDFGNLVRVPS